MIREVCTYFVPVAVNLYKIREARDAGGELFRSVRRQRNQYQGIWIVSPDGEVLGGHHEVRDHARWTEEALSAIVAARKAFGPVPERRDGPSLDPLPFRGAGVEPDGGIRLALTVRGVRGGGRDSAPPSVNPASRWIWEGELRRNGPPVIDTLRLDAGEWQAFAPGKGAAVGTEWALPEPVARKFVRALSPSSDQSTMPRPHEAGVAELRARVEATEGRQVRVRLWGRWETKHIYAGKPSFAWAGAEGIALCEAGPGGAISLRSLLLTFSGAYRMAPPYDRQDTPTAAVAEWRRVVAVE